MHRPVTAWRSPAAAVRRKVDAMNLSETRTPSLTRRLVRTADLSVFDTILLSELGDAGLMRRVDTKFVFPAAWLPDVLEGLTDKYRLLEVAGRAEHDYVTLYFDTPAFDLFGAHHSGVADRVKVRERLYLSTNQLFLEIKHRNNKGVTNKVRSEARAWAAALDPQEVVTVGAPRPWRQAGGELEPALWNAYRRVTLVRDGAPERVTIDTGVRFMAAGERFELSGLAIAEVKQPRVDRGSPFMQRMRALGVRSGGFSKYCTGVSLLMPTVKHNRFRPRLRAMERAMGGKQHVA